MDSIQHLRVTRNLGAPKGWDPEKGKCNSLPIQDTTFAGQPAMQSLWRPTPEEIMALQDGGVVCLTVLSNLHPPVALYVAQDPLKD